MSSGELPLARSARLVRESLAAYQCGQLQAAQALAVSAYLDGFELAEASLDAVDRRLRMAVEAEMMRYRTMINNQEPTAAVEAQGKRVQGLLVETATLLAGARLPAGAVFFSAFVILLREGLEAVLVLAAILALLIKGGRQDALPYVHAGWIAALALGGCTWFVASYVIALSGATREVTEGITALVAAVVLLYMGFWMHSKSYANRWQAFLQEQLHTALSARAMWALAASVIPGSVSRGVRDSTLLSSAVDTSCSSVCPHAWWLAGCRRDTRRARVATLSRQYPSPSRAFFRCYLGFAGSAGGDIHG
jgi:high-affinity iron transporter